MAKPKTPQGGPQPPGKVDVSEVRTRLYQEPVDIRSTPESDKDDLRQALRRRFYEGELVPDEMLEETEFIIRVQKQTSSGRPIHGGMLRFSDPNSVIDEVSEKMGGGRYTFWIQYRPASTSEKLKFVKATDIDIIAPPGHVPTLTAQPAQGGEQYEPAYDPNEPPYEPVANELERGDDGIPSMGQMMMLMMQGFQSQNAALISALTNRQPNPSTDPNALFDMMTRAIEIGQRSAGLNPQGDESTVMKVIGAVGPVIEIIKTLLVPKPGGGPAFNPEALRTALRANPELAEALRRDPQSRPMVDQLLGVPNMVAPIFVTPAPAPAQPDTSKLVSTEAVIEGPESNVVGDDKGAQGG